ncbi:MAG: cytidylyltransferase domain-containing protein [Alphaproteobacteria bacterium]
MIAAIVQARMGSSRLPGKTLADIGGRPMLGRLVDRARQIPGIERVVIATTDRPDDEAILRFAEAEGLPASIGSEQDVLDRVYRAAVRFGVSVIVRVTPDCPMLDPDVSGRVLAEFRRLEGRVDYVSNAHPPTFPDGLDTEVISYEALEVAWREARLASEREHVTPFIWRQPARFRLANVAHAEDLSSQRWTVDTAPDLAFARAVHDALGGTGRIFGMADVLRLLAGSPEIRDLNSGQQRNEGLVRSLAADAAARTAR